MRGMQVQVSELIGTVARQEQITEECKAHIEDLHANNQKKWLIIKGIIRDENEKPKDAVQKFLREQSKITEEIKIKDAFSLGKGLAQPIKFKVERLQDKYKILGSGKMLKDIKNVNGKPYRINEQLPGRRQAYKARCRQIKYENSKPENVTKKNITFINKKMLIDGEPYSKVVKAPTVADVICANAPT